MDQKLLLYVIVVMILAGCANPISPTGGPRDEQPPRVDSSKSTPNFQTNFTGSGFELTFDEWVKLEDIFSQVVVSPPLDYDLRLKKKTVLFELEEGDTLRANTTYTVNFGESVKDLTENNPAEDLRFVFSTGPFLDSLTVRGRIIDVETREPVEGVFFMLYDNTADTVVRTERPYYFGKTDLNGRFEINNIREGTYKGFALKDADLNYLYNQTGEPVAFPDSLIRLFGDSVPVLNLLLFKGRTPLRLLNSDARRYGAVKLIFNQEDPEGFDLLIPDTLGLNYYTETIRDTFKVWYDGPLQSNWRLFVRNDSLVDDTINVNVLNRQAFLNTARLTPADNRSSRNIRINPDKEVDILWNHPLQAIDTSRILFLEDSTRSRQPNVQIDSLQARRLVIDFPWLEDSIYLLTILPGAVTDLFGLPNDTVSVTYRVDPRTEFGNIILNISELDSNRAYIGELSLNNKVIHAFYIDSTAVFDQRFNTLTPGKYTVRLIEDNNRNRIWDTGNYDLKRQPEIIYTRELDQLRANWDLEVEIPLSELKVIPEKEDPRQRRRTGG